MVAGGTGSVGEGLVRSFLKGGATVVVPYRTEARRDALLQYTSDLPDESPEGTARGTLACVPCALDSEQDMMALRDHLATTYPAIDLAVACIGGWYYGYSLHHMPLAHWSQIIESNLLTHFLCQRTIVSLMHERNHGTYVMVNGGSAELIAPESGAVSIASAAQLMMSRVLKQEARATGVRIHSLMAYHPVKTRNRGSEVVDEWYTAEELGDYVIRLHHGAVTNADKTIHRLYTRSRHATAGVHPHPR